MNPLEKVFPNNAPEVPVERDVPLWTERNAKAPAIKAAKPRVCIPVFPGTNCEYDTARAFEKAGAETEILVVRNLSAAAIEETIARLEQAVRRAQIVMLPGGFSGGDEPDGSGKFIATTFRSPPCGGRRGRAARKARRASCLASATASRRSSSSASCPTAHHAAE